MKEVSKRIAVVAVVLAVGGCTALTTVPTVACGLCDVAGKSAPVDTITARGVDAVALATTLADHGRRTNSPLALLTAAELLSDASPSPLDATKSGASVAAGSKAGARVTLDPAQLVAAARAIDTGGRFSTAISDLQARIAAPKASVRGPRVHVERVNARSTDSWTIAFRGGEHAAIRVRGDGDTDLDCYVYDSNGRLVAYDNDYTDYCILDWYPSFTNSHRLEIRNLGDVYNEYVLTTN